MGRIYIDPSCDAIVALDYRLEVVIPFAVKPILFGFGMEIDRPLALAKIRYQRIGDLYYPQYFRRQIKIHMKKKYIWAKNEDGDFFVEQLISINSINNEEPTSILKEKRFVAEKSMSEQVQNDEGISWKNVNTLKLEGKGMSAKKLKW
jgi:hypothetical protein